MSRFRSPRLEVRESAIAGRGLFALERIEVAACIMEYTGERVAYEEGERRYISTVPFHTFLFGLADGRTIDAGVGGNDCRFINHSCEPNCVAHEKYGRIFIYARRIILVGDELLLDYRFQSNAPDDAEANAAYPCTCGAPSCRGTMVRTSCRPTDLTPAVEPRA